MPDRPEADVEDTIREHGTNKANINAAPFDSAKRHSGSKVSSGCSVCLNHQFMLIASVFHLRHAVLPVAYYTPAPVRTADHRYGVGPSLRHAIEPRCTEAKLMVGIQHR